MVDLDTLISKLKFKTKFQPIPVKFDDYDYMKFVFSGIQRLYTDFGYEGYSDAVDEEMCVLLKTDFTNSQVEYILNGACIAFYELCQQDVNTIVGYSTDSLSVTHADKPYANISNEIDKLTHRNYEIFHKIEAGTEV